MEAAANPDPAPDSGFDGDRSVPPTLADDEAVLAALADALGTGIVDALGPWVQRSVERIAEAWRPGLGAQLAPAAAEAGRRATEEVGPRVRALLALDLDEQRTGPLAVVRTAVAYPTAVLADAGVPGVVRDDFSERAFPDDRYDLAPAAFADLDPSLAEPGLRWGAAKAHVVLRRRRERDADAP